jgi:hypothetical protein
MVEHGLLMRGDMVRATLGVELPGGVPKRRTWRRMDRRTYRWWAATDWETNDDGWPVVRDFYGDVHPAPCHLGAVGDRLWVRETWAPAVSEGYDAAPRDGRPHPDSHSGCLYPCWYRATDGGSVEIPGVDVNGDVARWRPSLHMPRWASRLTLGILGVRFLRPVDFSQAEAREEGFRERVLFLAALTSMHGESVLKEYGWAIHYEVLEVRS